MQAKPCDSVSHSLYVCVCVHACVRVCVCVCVCVWVSVDEKLTVHITYYLTLTHTTCRLSSFNHPMDLE